MGQFASAATTLSQSASGHLGADETPEQQRRGQHEDDDERQTVAHGAYGQPVPEACLSL